MRRIPVPGTTVGEVIDFMRRNPGVCAVISDFDGVLAPIVPRDQTTRMPEAVRSDLRRIHARYRLTAVITGRRAHDAAGLVGIENLHVIGNFGAEQLRPGHRRVSVSPLFVLWRWRVRQVAMREWRDNLAAAGAVLEDKGSVIVFHWRGAPDEDAARAAVESAAQRARAAGLGITRGKKAIEFGPPLMTDKGTAIESLLRRNPQVRCAIYFGDDLVDIPAMKALERMVAEGKLDAALRVGVTSPETPVEVVAAANYVVAGTDGVARILNTLAQPLT